MPRPSALMLCCCCSSGPSPSPPLDVPPDPCLPPPPGVWATARTRRPSSSLLCLPAPRPRLHLQPQATSPSPPLMPMCRAALELGYRHIDCAWFYGTEEVRTDAERRWGRGRVDVGGGGGGGGSGVWGVGVGRSMHAQALARCTGCMHRARVWSVRASACCVLSECRKPCRGLCEHSNATPPTCRQARPVGGAGRGRCCCHQANTC